MVNYDEEKILELLCSKNTFNQAFSMIVNQYSEPLYWKIRRIVLTHEDANDVLQNTFLKAWNNIETFQAKSKLSTWLYRIAINESLDFLRKKNRFVEAEIENMQVTNQLIADNYFDGDKTQALLQEAISTLPNVQRAVFNMRYYDETKYSEMSKILNTSEGALKASYHLAVKKIKEFFEAHD